MLSYVRSAPAAADAASTPKRAREDYDGTTRHLGNDLGPRAGDPRAADHANRRRLATAYSTRRGAVQSRDRRAGEQAMYYSPYVPYYVPAYYAYRPAYYYRPWAPGVVVFVP